MPGSPLLVTTAFFHADVVEQCGMQELQAEQQHRGLDGVDEAARFIDARQPVKKGGISCVAAASPMSGTSGAELQSRTALCNSIECNFPRYWFKPVNVPRLTPLMGNSAGA